MRKAFFGIIVWIGLSGPGLAQESNDPGKPPLEISSVQIVPAPFPPGDEVQFKIRNMTPKSVIGYVLAIALQDSAGRSYSGGRYLIAEKHPVPKEKGEFSPSDTWTEALTLGETYNNDVRIQYVGAEISVDYVRFADGSSWGPDKGRHGFGLGRFRQGVLIERSRLRRLLTEEGVQFLLDDLVRENDPPK